MLIDAPIELLRPYPIVTRQTTIYGVRDKYLTYTINNDLRLLVLDANLEKFGY